VCVRLRQDVSPVRCRQLSSAAAPYMEKQITKKRAGVLSGHLSGVVRGTGWGVCYFVLPLQLLGSLLQNLV
jgi:hypothetical protein